MQLSFHFKIRDEVGSNEGDTLFVARVLFPKSATSFLSKIRDEVGLNEEDIAFVARVLLPGNTFNYFLLQDPR